MKDVEKEPVLSEVAVAVNEPNVTVTLEEVAKPEPEAITGDPTIPEFGFRVIIGTLTKKTAVPMSPEPSVTVRAT